MTDSTTNKHGMEFDPITHIYTVDGVRPPSVTGILAAEGFYPNKERYTQEARERGTSVHEYTAAYDAGWLDESKIPEIVRPYLEAYKQFRADSGFLPTLIEHRVYSRRHGYAGTLDRIGTLNGWLALVDIKTGQPTPADALQTAAYLYAYNETSGNKEHVYRYGLYLRNNGTYKLVPHTDRDDINIFLAAVTLYRWKKSKGIYKEVI